MLMRIKLLLHIVILLSYIFKKSYCSTVWVQNKSSRCRINSATHNVETVTGCIVLCKIQTTAVCKDISFNRNKKQCELCKYGQGFLNSEDWILMSLIGDDIKTSPQEKVETTSATDTHEHTKVATTTKHTETPTPVAPSTVTVTMEEKSNSLRGLSFVGKHNKQPVIENHYEFEDFSVCFWMKPKYLTAKQMFVLAAPYPISSSTCDYFAIDIIDLKLRAEYMNVKYQLDYMMASDTLYHICILSTFKNQKSILYVNGTFQNEITVQYDKKKPYFIVLGVDTDNPSKGCVIEEIQVSFQGFLGEVYIWNKALNEDEIESLYKEEKINATPIVDWGRFLEIEDNENVKKRNITIDYD